MKAFLVMVGWGLVSSVAFGAQEQLPSGGEVPAVRNVAIFTTEGCALPPPRWDEQAPCPASDEVTFEVETTGSCDVFTTEVDPGGAGETYLTIVKQKVPNCTRPEHEARIERKTLILADELQGSVRLGNPILVEKHFRQ